MAKSKAGGKKWNLNHIPWKNIPLKKYWENVSWAELILIIMLAFVMMYVLLYKLGTLSSGFHFLDDHELIRMEVAFEEQEQSLGSIMKGNITNDLNSRFRPLYWVERCSMAYLFGSNMLYWNYYTALKGIITFCLLYFTARHLKCNPIISGLFTCLILYGAQFTPWYRSANQENTGLMLCALAMLLIAVQAYYKKYKSSVLNVFIVVSVILCGLIKESFTLVMPALAAGKFWLEYQEETNLKLWDCFKRNWLTYSMIIVAFLANVFALLFLVRVDQVTYAGFHGDAGLAEYWQGIVTSYQLYLRWYINLAVVLLILLIIGARKRNWVRYFGYWLIGGYVIVVQLVSHAKSGMWERYIIPWIVGYAVVFVIVGYKMLSQTRLCKWIYLLVLCALLYMEAPTALTKGRDYAYEGWMTSLYFQSVLDNTEENSEIVSAFFDEELNVATECWLETHGRTQVYSCRIDTGELINLIQLRGSIEDALDWQNASVITCYDYQVDGILEALGFSNPSQYTVSVNGHYAVIGRSGTK